MNTANDEAGNRRVLMIGLDAAPPALVEPWMDDGTLPNLAALRQRGMYGELDSSARYISGSPWPTFYTGRPPSEHGLYADFQWRPLTLDFSGPGRDWLEVEPFWRRLDDDVPVVAVDVPFQLGCTPFNGAEVSNWATHDKLVAASSHPPDLLEAIRTRFGEWPLPHETYGRDPIDQHLALRDKIVSSTGHSAELAKWMLQRRWRLAIVCLAGVHRGGHRLWDRSGIKGGYGEAEGHAFDDALRECYVAADRAVGELIATAQDATVIVFSLHGMTTNVERVDLLDQMLARVLSHGEGGAAPGKGLARRVGDMLPISWVRFVAKNIPGPLRNRAMTMWQSGGIDWEKTIAFTLRADLQGYIRINLAGREAHGIVQPGADYDDVCGRIAEGLMTFRDADTGEPFIDEICRVEDVFPPGERRDLLPDLIVLWRNTSGATHRAVRSQRFGEVERATPRMIPGGRSGNHDGRGLIIAGGAGIPAGVRLRRPADIMDLAPTVVEMLGARCHLPLRGAVIAELAQDALAPT